MTGYWEDRALPVLNALRTSDNRNVCSGFLSLGHGRAEAQLALGLSDDAVHNTILQLGDAAYVEFNPPQYESGGGVHFSGLRVTGRGMQVLGEWPRFEAMISPATLAALIETLAEYAPPNEAHQMREGASVVRRMAGATLKSLAMGAGGQLLRGALGLP